MLESIYVQALAVVFTVSNSIKVFSYVPMAIQLAKLKQPAKGQSELTWFLWVLCNLSIALHMFEVNARQLDWVVLLMGANAGMCLLCFALIRRARRFPQEGAPPISNHSPTPYKPRSNPSVRA